MDLVNIRDIFRNQAQYENQVITIGGWVRSNRNSKNFGFIVVNDGTFFEPIQVVYADGLAVFVRRNIHLVIMPCVTVLLGGAECPIHQLFPEWLVGVNETQLPEGRQDQIFFDLFNFTECDHIPAHIVKAHDGDAVVGAACAVVKILLAAEVCAPVGKKLCVSQLHLLPDRLALRLRIVQGDFRQNFLFAGLGI